MKRVFLMPWVVGVVLGVGVIAAMPTPCAASPMTSVIAQASQDQPSNSRTSGRAVRGLVKLGIGAVVAIVAGVGWLINKSKQKQPPPSA